MRKQKRARQGTASAERSLIGRWWAKPLIAAWPVFVVAMYLGYQIERVLRLFAAHPTESRGLRLRGGFYCDP